MAASTLASNDLALKTGKAHHEDIFFCTMALIILGTVLLGFAQSYYLAGVFQAHLPNLLVHIHAVVFSTWILLFITQTLLISVKRLDLHRRIGILGAGLAAFFYSIPFFSTAVFCFLIIWALRARFDGPTHRRLILIATISLLGRRSIAGRFRSFTRDR